MKWVEPAGLVKFDFLGLKTLTVLDRAVKLDAAARHRDRPVGNLPLDDTKTYEMLARGETVGVFQVESAGMRRALVDMRPDRFEDIDRAGRALPAGADGQHPDLLRAQARPRDDRIPSSEARADPEARPTASSPIRSRCSRSARSRRLHASARPIFCAAPWARRSEAEMDAQRDRFVCRRGRARHRAGHGGGDLRRLRANSPNTASTRSHFAAYALRHLSDRLSEGELSGRVPRRVDDARHGQHRQARRIPRRGRAARHQGRAALDQPLGRRIRGRRQHHLLCAGGAARRRPPGGREHRRRARRAAVRRSGRFRRAASIRARSTSGCWKASSPPAPSTPSRRTGRAFSPPSDTILATAQRAHEDARDRPVGAVRRPGRARADRSARGRKLAAGRAAADANTTRSASSSAAIRSTIMPPRSRGCACSPGRSFRAP